MTPLEKQRQKKQILLLLRKRLRMTNKKGVALRLSS
jgi:hypothetical protein